MAVKLYLSRTDDSLYDSHDTGPWGVKNFYWQQLLDSMPSSNYLQWKWIDPGFESYPLNFYAYNVSNNYDKSFFRDPSTTFADMVSGEGFTRIPKATWQFQFYVSMAGGAWTIGTHYSRVEVYKRSSAGVLTKLFETYSPVKNPGGNLWPVEWTSEQDAFDFDLSDDRIVLKAYCYGTAPNAQQLKVGTGQASNFELLDMSDEPPKMGVLDLATGWRIGNIQVRDRGFTAECRSRAQHFSQQIVDLFSPTCRARLGDAECGIDLDDSLQTYVHEGTVTSVTDERTKFVDSSVTGVTEDVFRYGLLTWLEPESSGASTGDNAGFQVEVKKYSPDTKEFELFEAMPYSIQVGDPFTVTWGCDKTHDTCLDRFDNKLNFRGEPFVPGGDAVTKYY